MKRIGTVILLFLLLGTLVIPCFAAEDSPLSDENSADGVSESIDEEVPEDTSAVTEGSDDEPQPTAAPSGPPAGDSGGEPEQTAPPSAPPSDPPSSSEDHGDPSGGGQETPVSTPIRLVLDNENVYEGMTKAYKDGYVPTVNNGILTLVVPLIADGALKDNKLVVTPNLGAPNASPFEYKNYQKAFYLESHPVNRQDDAENADFVEAWLVWFDFPLKADRSNGTYSIVLDVQALDENGALVQKSITCYGTITDGVVTGANTDLPTAAGTGFGGGAVSAGFGGGSVSAGFGSGTEMKTPESQPKILIKSYTVSASPVTAGDDFTVTVTLWNTSETRSIQNMVVTVSCDSPSFVLKNDSSTIYVGDLEAGGSTDVELRYGTDLETPAQRYGVRLVMEYDNSDAVTLTSSGSVTVEVAQPLSVELSPFRMASEVNAGETIQLAFQVMNLGRGQVYNVRLELEVPGLEPVGTAFIGNMMAGTSAETSMNVFIGMKDGEDRYGFTSGILRLICEDASGQEFVQETDVATTVKELVIAPAADDGDEEEAVERASQWWISLAIGGAVIVVLATVALWKKRVKV